MLMALCKACSDLKHVRMQLSTPKRQAVCMVHHLQHYGVGGGAEVLHQPACVAHVQLLHPGRLAVCIITGLHCCDAGGAVQVLQQLACSCACSCCF